MAQRTVTIGSRVGLHARPAAAFVQAASGASTRVTIRKEGGTPVDARSILGVLALGVKNGETVILETDGESAEHVLDGLADLLARDLDASADG